MTSSNSFYIKYDPSKIVELQLEIKPSSSKSEGFYCTNFEKITTYKPLFFNAKLVNITSELVTFGIQLENRTQGNCMKK